MDFLSENYLLENKPAQILYEQVKELPIIDLHNHGDVKEIIENKNYNDIWEVEAATDHYIWGLMRRRGISEKYITGEASNRDKWFALSKVFPEFIGNPSYEWMHLDLKRRFGINKTISSNTAKSIWEKTSMLLAKDKMKPQNLLNDMNVKIMCTTDNPVSKLEYHKKAQKEIDWLDILPTWRPDHAMKIGQELWRKFHRKLANRTSKSMDNFDSFLQALEDTHDYFDKLGCIASDHGLTNPISHKTNKIEINKIYLKALKGEKLSHKEIKDFQSYMLMFFGELNQKKDWTMQLHIGAVRDYRNYLFHTIGSNSGGDICSYNANLAKNLKYFLNAFDSNLDIIIYILNPTHLPVVSTIARTFPNVEIGAPWWFNDSSYGMKKHFKLVSTYDLLANQAEMVTDSRKLMSYGSRTEVFRRTLCSVVGEFVDLGQVPLEAAENLVKDLCYKKPVKRFSR